MSIYTKMLEAGCTIDHHESDLYVLATQASGKILDEHCRDLGLYSYSSFNSEVDGKLWFEIPFSYDPWWEHRASRA